MERQETLAMISMYMHGLRAPSMEKCYHEAKQNVNNLWNNHPALCNPVLDTRRILEKQLNYYYFV